MKTIYAEEIVLSPNFVTQSIVDKNDILFLRMTNLLDEILKTFDFGLEHVIECHLILSEPENFGKYLGTHVYILLMNNGDMDSYKLDITESIMGVEIEHAIVKNFSKEELNHLSTINEYADKWGNIALEKFIQKYTF